jgi:hypothetical protein
MNILVRPKRPAPADRTRKTRSAAFGVATASAELALEAMRAKEQNAAASPTTIEDAVEEALEWARRP